MIFLKFKELLNNYQKYDFSNNIYVSTKGLLLIDTICLLIDDDEFSEDSIVINGTLYNYLMNIDVIYSSIENLNQQRENPTDEEYLKAINFYIENDAFIDLENEVH
jgi:hypothetical protein